ncbi:hypothetical protein Acr_11g0003760 [Actinidia rufa]|uniref:SWIM-type domain-containing protein n=1 Tax=Actinidia rufa TaxID=165716 RepID=A0A7J0FBI0_9ERIC|nr:hypothetical protein Acr_11g0003760 [Actinidia rufa]
MTTMVMFYWGGKIIRDRRKGISYDIDATVCYDVELGTLVAQLRDMIISMVAEYGEHVSIKFICRYPHRRNGDVMIYKKLPINDDKTLQNVLNIPSRHPDHQHVEIYVVKEEVSTMNTNGSHTAVGWADVHIYGELLSGRGYLSTLGSFTQMLALGQSSRSILAEEAPGQRMCSLFSQGKCIEAGGASGSVDPVERLVALGETGTQDNEDVDGDPNVGEALHDNPHILFFTNLVGADDVVGGRDLYDGCLTWSDVTPEFAKGMVFKDKDAVIRACNCNVKVKDLIWKAGIAHQVRKFDEAMDEIKKLGTNLESATRMYRALCNEDPRKWTLAHDGGYRWGVTTTNDLEYYNNVLRGARDLPITSCVEVTFYRLVATFNDKRRASGSADVVTSAAGTTGNNKHAVYLNSPSCDCGKWMIYHYPCSHMLAVCAKSGRQPWHLIDPKYKMDVYAHVYNTSFEPMVHEHYWAAYDGPKIIPHPSRRRDPTSGCPTKRIHNEMDVSRKRQNNYYGPMDNVGSPGPIDGTVLTLQAHHRSTWIWEHGGTDALARRRYGSGLYDRELDPCVLQYVLRVGFYGECQDKCMQAFGVIPPVEEIDSGRLRMSWLCRTFDILPKHTDDVNVQRHARACSWGSAVLAMLYRSMCRATKIGQRQITGALLLLQIWACERFPRMCPHRMDDHIAGQQPLLIGGMHFPGGPWGARWRSRFRTTTTSTYVIRVYRDQLDCLRPDEFTWRPYDGIMHELPDYCRVASDIWVIPVAIDTSPTLHVGVIDAAAMRYDDPYMVWYRHITRTLVGNPAHRLTSGYVEIGSTIEIATRYIAAIHDHIDRVIYAYDRPESLQDMYDARDMCSRSLHALREHKQIEHPEFTQCVDATQTSASYVTPAMPSYTYHILSHDVPSSSRPSSSGVRPRRTTHRHITSLVTYDQSSSYLPIGDEEEFDGYVDPLLASTGQIEIPVSVEGVSQITQAESQRPLEPQPQSQPHRLGTLTHVFSRRPRPSRDRRPPRCGTRGHV